MKNILFIFLFLLVSSCAISTYYLQSDAKTYAATNKDNVKLFSDDIKTDYNVIGSIAVDVPGGGKAAEAELKKKAAAIGANAVIFCKLTKISSLAQRTGISGVAIKFK